MKVGPFIPCYIDAFFLKVGVATPSYSSRPPQYQRDRALFSSAASSRMSRQWE
jgi:hypothetical protein